jgi:hypothetical protein
VEIGVAVKEGIVTLTGRVPGLAQKSVAEHAVRYLRGVKGVTYNIVINPAVTADVVKGRPFLSIGMRQTQARVS